MKIITSDMILFYKNLTSDGCLTRFKDQDEEREEEKMDLKLAPIITGYEALASERRPPLELWMNSNLLMCIPFNEKKDWWLMFLNYNQMGDWMENISLIYKAHEVQKDFIIANRLVANKDDNFCQLQHDLRHRNESSKINYTINVPHPNGKDSEDNKVCYQNGNITTCYNNTPKAENPLKDTTVCYKYSNGQVLCNGNGSSKFHDFTSIFGPDEDQRYNRSDEFSTHSSKRNSFINTNDCRGILKKPINQRERPRSRSASQVRFKETETVCESTRAF